MTGGVDATGGGGIRVAASSLASLFPPPVQATKACAANRLRKTIFSGKHRGM
jgi:hypothetical protein